MLRLLAALLLLPATLAAQTDSPDPYDLAEAVLRTVGQAPQGSFSFDLTLAAGVDTARSTGTLAYRRPGSDLERMHLRVEDDDALIVLNNWGTWLRAKRTGEAYHDTTGATFQNATAYMHNLSPYLLPGIASAYFLGSDNLSAEPVSGDLSALTTTFSPPLNGMRRATLYVTPEGEVASLSYVMIADEGLVTLEIAYDDVRAGAQPDSLFASFSGEVIDGSTSPQALLIETGAAAPALALPGPGGEMVRLSDYAGQVVLLDFWGTWCAPCIAALPDLAALADDYAGEVTVLGVSSYEDSSADPAAVAREAGARYPILTGGETVTEAFGVHAFPSYVVVGRDGTVRFAAYDAQPDALRAALDAALAE